MLYEMRRRLVFAFVALALVAVPSASAKGPFQVCGASGCAVLGPETQPPVRMFGLPADTPAIAAPEPAPYYVIRFADITGTLAYWVPSRSALRIVPQSGPAAWVSALPAEESLLRDKTAALRPYAVPLRVQAYVDWQPVKQPFGWLKLATVGKPATPPAPPKWLDIWLLGGTSPWNDGSALLAISRTGNYLLRDGAVLTIPKQVADRIRRRLPLG
jgi:hypothetical protein